MKTIAVIMAGGRGERFWPRSRLKKPKQFLSITDDNKPMIVLTIERLKALIEPQDFYIVTNAMYAPLVAEQLPHVAPQNVLYEPCARNTAPAIGLAAVYVRKRLGDAVMVILPSDHLITKNNLYLENVSQAIALAAQGDNLVTIGIVPEYPETGYGYLQCTGNRVKRFVEKPNAATAAQYIAQGDFLWNSGQFFWKASTILACFKQFAPDTYKHLIAIENAIGTEHEAQVLEAEFPHCVSESIDHSIMEKASNVFAITGTFGWDDVGSWLSLERTKKSDVNGNVIEGNVLTYDTKNSIIQGQKKLIAAVGLEDCIIIDTDDALYICKKERNQDIKKILEQLNAHNKTDYV